MKTLLKIDSTGKIRVINLWTEEQTLHRTAGVLDGKLVHTFKDSKPKNIGKVNATTAAAQAILEMHSAVARKLDETYVLAPFGFMELTEEEIITYIKDNMLAVPQAMLAKPFNEKYADWDGGVMASPKLDGMRCMAVIPATGNVVLWSRGGKKIETMGHIVAELSQQRPAEGTVILDGELYLHDKDNDNFQENMKAIKKYREGFSEKVMYWVYDTINDTINARDRFTVYDHFCDPEWQHIVALEQVVVKDFDAVQALHTAWLTQGYEGTMLKNSESMYRQKARSSDLLKVKDFTDQEYKILDILPMDNKPEFGIALMETPEGLTFKATPKMNHEQRRQLLADREQYIGGAGTVTFFEKTGDGLPRFPVLKAVTVKGDLEEFRL